MGERNLPRRHLVVSLPPVKVELSGPSRPPVCPRRHIGSVEWSWVVNTRSIALSIQNLEHLDMNETVGTDPMTTVRSMLAIQISKGSSSLFDNYLKRGEIPKITNWVDADLGASFCDQHVRPKVSEASVPLSRSRELHVSGRTVSVPPRGECGSEYVGFRQVGDLGNVNRSGFAT